MNLNTLTDSLNSCTLTGELATFVVGLIAGALITAMIKLTRKSDW